jgi:17beta-estradiol 17-dehydrogenase / very-long-chain 3-oxoacyl-CoA reductase
MLATYSGSKAFLSTYTSALAEEVKPHNIVVQHVNAFYVVRLFFAQPFLSLNRVILYHIQVSKMSKLRKPSPLVPLPSTYVHSVLSKVGLSCGAAFSDRPGTSTPFWSHALADYVINLVGWKSLFIGYTYALHKDIRKRALRKKERDAKRQ